jgi:phospholipid/cholesterol/gamma-HCH transport system substrate-binding protein
MLTRTVRTRVLVFIVLGLLAVSYIAVRYVGLLRLVGVGTYTVHVELSSAGGIFPNAEVDYRGVPVGRVGDVTLTAAGVDATLQLNSSGGHIPSNVEAVVTDRSVIGEQYVDLRPRTDSGPYLADGSRITMQNSAIPPSANELLTSTDALLKSVPIRSMQTVVDELGTAFGGSADNVRRLIDASKAFITAANANFSQTSVLIDTSKTVLKTQLRTSSSIRSFSANLNLLAQQLVSNDSSIRELLAATPPAARTAASLIRELGAPLGVLINNLTTTSQVFQANVRGVQELLIQVPHAVDIGSTVVTPRGANVGLTLTFFNPLPCTQGYQGTTRRSGLDTGPGQPLNTSAGCTSSDASDLHGSQHVPSDTGVAQPWLDSYADTDVTTVGSLAQLMGS